AHKFGREAGQPVELVVGMALLDRDGAAFDKSFIAQPLAQGRDEMRERCGRSATQKPDHRHRRLLRPRRDWPTDCHAAEPANELPAFQLIELHSVPPARAGLQDIELARISERISDATLRYSATPSSSLRPPRQTCEIFATLGKSFHPVTLQSGFPAPLSRSYNRWGRGMVSHFINEPEHWLARAEEARILANQMNDVEAKVAMLRIAEDYERLAQRAEGRPLGRLPNSN